MKVNVTSSKGLESKLSVKKKKKEIQEKIDKKLDEVKDTINLKGFRPGKAPRELLKEKQPSLNFVKKEQIAKLIYFLCSKEASEITGSAISIDGAWTAQ